MNEELLNRLKEITPEEKSLLDGRREIDRTIYTDADSERIDAALLLEHGKLITLRPHTRFAHFPKHTHNYVEMIYMCSGETVHIINGTEITLKCGELLILNQNAEQEILPASENDVAVNFIILPQFFDTAVRMIDETGNQIHDFLIGCMRGGENGGDMLHFKVSDVLPVQNLVENLIWTLLNRQSNKRSINQLTMGLLFMQLANHTDSLSTEEKSGSGLMLNVLRYIDANYAAAELGCAANELHYDACWLSREIKKQSGKTFTELLQDKRLEQACYLLRTTNLKVSEVCRYVGYSNFSYFHRIFKGRFGVSPRRYRVCK